MKHTSSVSLLFTVPPSTHLAVFPCNAEVPNISECPLFQTSPILYHLVGISLAVTSGGGAGGDGEEAVRINDTQG